MIDLTTITPGQDVTLEFDGGGNADTVMVVRVAGKISSSLRVNWALTGGLRAENLLIYSAVASSNYGGGCDVGVANVGNGTLFCPDARMRFGLDTQWTGAILGGSGGSSGAILMERRFSLTPDSFRGF